MHRSFLQFSRHFGRENFLSDKSCHGAQRGVLIWNVNSRYFSNFGPDCEVSVGCGGVQARRSVSVFTEDDFLSITWRFLLRKAPPSLWTSQSPPLQGGVRHALSNGTVGTTYLNADSLVFSETWFWND
eukprot:EG_transcript_34686